MKQIKELLTQLKKADEKEQIQLLLEFSEKQKQQLENEIKTNETLKSSLAHYKQLFNLLPNGGEVIDAKGKIIDCSINTAKMIGYEVDEIVGKHIIKFVDEDTAKTFKQNFQKLLCGKSLSLEGCFVHKNGRKINVIRSAQPIRNAENEVTGVLVVSTDITEQKKTEEELLKKTILLDNIINRASNVAIATTDLDFRITSYNDIAKNFFGYSAKEVIGKTVHEMHIMENVEPERLEKALIIVEETGEYNYFVNQEVNNERRVLSSRVTKMLDEKGKMTGYALFSQDVTQLVLAEEALKDSESNLRQIIDLVPHFIYVKDEDGKDVLLNKAVTDAYGITTKEFIGKSDMDITPDKKNAKKFFKDDLEVINTGKQKYIPEEQITDSKGNIRFLETTKIPFKTSMTKKRAILGVSIDITERKQEEENQKAKVKQLQMMNDIMVGRELTLNDTRKEVNELLEKLGEEPKYVVISTD